MSEATDSNIRTIYIPLLNEGVDVWRPAPAISLGNDIFQVLKTADYDVAGEDWQFPPGTSVRCAIEVKEGEKILVAKETVRI